MGGTTRGAGGVLVTGASSGIGRAAALALDGAGFAVFAGVRSAQASAELIDSAARAAAARGGSSRLRCVELDVTDRAAVAAAVTAIEDGLQREGGGRGFAGLLANAGISVNAPLEFLALDELRRQLEVNVVAQLAVIQAFLPLLRRDRGRIVLTGSVSGFLAMPYVAAYCMSKHALEAMADALRLELRAWGIQVSLLQPGQVRTAIWEKGRRDAEGLLASGPPALRERYGAAIDAALRVAERAERAGAPPEAVAAVVVRAFTSRRARARYLAGGHARLQRVVAMLPDRVRDRVLSRLLGG